MLHGNMLKNVGKHTGRINVKFAIKVYSTEEEKE